MIVDVAAAIACVPVPAYGLPVTAEEVALADAFRRQTMKGLGIRIDVKSIHRAIGLAREMCPIFSRAKTGSWQASFRRRNRIAL